MKPIGRHNSSGLVILACLLALAVASNALPVQAYVPQKGDSFSYTDTTTVNNGQGSYTGYTDQTQTTGSETVNSVGGSNVSSSYAQSYHFSNNQGNSSSGTSSGNFTWSSSTYTYLKGTDNQVGYSSPIYVWFYMNPSLGVGQSFWALNTHMTINSKNFSLLLPSEGNRYVQTIEAVGTGQYQRNDAYGTFTATYTWTQYFDPTTGYIVGYNYSEHDDGSYQGQSGSFTYSDILFVSATSYSLTAGSVPVSSTTSVSLASPTFIGIIILATIVLLVLVGVVIYFVTRRRKKLPPHSATPVPPPSSQPSAPWQSNVDLGSKPSEQVVIREVAKVNCRFCGTLIPTTVDRCPYCGGPRQ